MFRLAAFLALKEVGFLWHTRNHIRNLLSKGLNLFLIGKHYTIQFLVLLYCLSLYYLCSFSQLCICCIVVCLLQVVPIFSERQIVGERAFPFIILWLLSSCGSPCNQGKWDFCMFGPLTKKNFHAYTLLFNVHLYDNAGIDRHFTGNLLSF